MKCAALVARALEHMTPKELADRFDTDESRVSRWKRGVNGMDSRHKKKLEEILREIKE